MSRETFTIEEIEIKQSSRGPFRRAKLSGIGWVSFFDKADGDFLEENMGQSASAEITTNDKGFKNGKGLQKAAGGDGEKMSKAEWDGKEDRQRIGILYSVHLKQMFEWYRLGLEKDDPSKDILHSYKDLQVMARKAAVADLDWIRNYATGDVPFSKPTEAPQEEHEVAA